MFKNLEASTSLRHQTKMSQDKKMKSSVSLVCPHCQTTCSTLSNLRRHIRSHDFGNVKSYQCNLCDNKFSRDDDVRKHINKVHNIDPKPRYINILKPHQLLSELSTKPTHTPSPERTPKQTEKTPTKGKIDQKTTTNWKKLIREEISLTDTSSSSDSDTEYPQLWKSTMPRIKLTPAKPTSSIAKDPTTNKTEPDQERKNTSTSDTKKTTSNESIATTSYELITLDVPDTGLQTTQPTDKVVVNINTICTQTDASQKTSATQINQTDLVNSNHIWTQTTEPEHFQLFEKRLNQTIEQSYICLHKKVSRELNNIRMEFSTKLGKTTQLLEAQNKPERSWRQDTPQRYEPYHQGHRQPWKAETRRPSWTEQEPEEKKRRWEQPASHPLDYQIRELKEQIEALKKSTTRETDEKKN